LEQFRNTKRERYSARNEFAGRRNIVTAGMNECGGHVDKRSKVANLSKWGKSETWGQEGRMTRNLPAQLHDAPHTFDIDLKY
jgi:hypothetical protein